MHAIRLHVAAVRSTDRNRRRVDARAWLALLPAVLALLVFIAPATAPAQDSPADDDDTPDVAEGWPARFARVLHVPEIGDRRAVVPAARPRLGCSLRNRALTTEEFGTAIVEGEAGVEATTVSAGSAAARAGLVAGDVFVKYGDLALTEELGDAFQELRMAILATEPYTDVACTVLRLDEVTGWQRHDITITIGAGGLDRAMAEAAHPEMHATSWSPEPVAEPPSALHLALIESELLDEVDRVAAAMTRISYSDEGEAYVQDAPVPFRLGEVVYTLRHPMQAVGVSRGIADKLLAASDPTAPTGLAGATHAALALLGVTPGASLAAERLALEDDYFANRERLGAARADARPRSALDSLVRAITVLSGRFLPESERRFLWDRLPLLYSGDADEEDEDTEDVPALTAEERVRLLRTLVALPIELHLADCAAFVDLFTRAFIDELAAPFRAGEGEAPTPVAIPNAYEDLLSGEFLLIEETEAGLVLVGGPGPNTYDVDAAVILDIGGNDTYHCHAGASTLDAPFAVCIDYAGNDYYEVDDMLPAQGAGRLGAGVLIDLAGKDGYHSKADSQGSGLLGIGVLADLDGQDVYEAGMTSQAAGVFGVGLLLDAGGHDRYLGDIFVQGFGGCFGVGALADTAGWDRYEAGGKYQDARDPTISTVSLSQGFGFGLRPYGDNPVGLSGGIGALLDTEGSDTYVCDYFGQGSSYYYALGILVDEQGDDQYRSGRYSQGAGTHYTTGVLIDEQGDDTYLATLGVSQGCGHDYSLGALWDSAGDDTYVGGWLLQGAGNANGIGLLVDVAGTDTYDGVASQQGWGTWNSGRNNGSFGALLDLGGTDDTYLTAGEPADTAYATNNARVLHNNPDGSPRWGLLLDR